MMSRPRPRVYVETSIVSYLTARPARDIVIAGRQQTTRDWWETAPTRFDLVISQLVREEAAIGDPEASRARLAALAPLTALAAPMEARELAQQLVNAGAVPKRAARDAMHVAIAAVHGVDFVVTWNFRHIANAVSRPRIESVCRRTGVGAPVLCTPEELVDVEVEDDER